MTFVDYHDYIRSVEWRKKSLDFKRKVGHCQRCTSKTKRLMTHHKTYERLGNELEGDLECLCKKCHEIEHKKKTLREWEEK
jgi:5-methylcytosine-specific restriction endonuclease McrA